ncbi:MAG: DNA-3-methyladenine glycosylase [Candidatus Jorgensenbacteria bacterium]
MSKIIPQKFFERPTLAVARELLGKYLVRRAGKHIIVAMITEVEAYDGLRDRASHASRGLTERNAPMFGPAGHWYVYFTYGMHWLVNIVTREKGYPAAVLIRSVQLIDVRRQSIGGPARVTKFFRIDKWFNGKSATRASGLWIEERGVKINKKQIAKSGRVGVDYAGPIWAKKQWNFKIK